MEEGPANKIGVTNPLKKKYIIKWEHLFWEMTNGQGN